MSILVGSTGTYNIGTGEIDLASQVGVSTSDKAEILLIVQNVGTVSLYVGPTGGTTNGYEITAGSEAQIRIPAGDRLFGSTSSGTATVRIMAVRG